MSRSWLKSILIAAIGALACSCASGQQHGDVAGRLTQDGMLVLNVEALESVQVHPGADLASFTDVVIEAPKVRFKEGWQPESTGSRLGASSRDFEEAGERLKSAFAEAFTRGLLENPRLQIVTQPEPGALRITPVLTEVTISDLGGEIGQAMTRKFGQVRLDLVIHDVRTGTLVAHIEDFRVLNNKAGGFGITGTNAVRGEFADLFQAWGAFTGKAILNISPALAE